MQPRDTGRMRAPLLVLVAVVGCAPAFTAVPNDDWQAVGPARRAAVDNAYAAEVAQLQHALHEANAAIAAAPSPRVTTAKPAAIAPGDEWADAMRRYEQEKSAARAQIDHATAAWQQAAVKYHREQAALITAQLAEARARHELDRATMIDRSLEASDTYDTAGYRGQLAQFQTPRFAAEDRVDVARVALQRAAGQMTAAKETYASLVRTGPLAPTSSDGSLQLAAFTPTTRYERSRHHEEHFLTAPTKPRIAGR